MAPVQYLTTSTTGAISLQDERVLQARRRHQVDRYRRVEYAGRRRREAIEGRALASLMQSQISVRERERPRARDKAKGPRTSCCPQQRVRESAGPGPQQMRGRRIRDLQVQPDHQTDQTRRLRLPQPRQLPAPDALNHRAQRSTTRRSMTTARPAESRRPGFPWPC